MQPNRPWFRETEVFTGGANGHHTYRIPSLVIANDGTILAFCEGRIDGQRDFQALYLVLKRSTDNGVTWEEQQQLVGDGELTMHNPTALVDRDTGTIWLAFNIECETTHLISSVDSGVTWSEPMDITSDVMMPNWTYYNLGPGHGNQLKSGALVFPACHAEGMRRDSNNMFSHVIISRDHGHSWSLGGSLPGTTDECELVETEDGSLYMAVRGGVRISGKRFCSWSRDQGNSWSELEVIDELPDPLCQASIVRFTDRNVHDKNRIVFANCASSTRDDFKVRVSYDECKTWPTGKILYPGPAAYSDLAICSDMTIACLYERGISRPYDGIRLAQFNIEWLTDGADTLC